MLIILLRDIYRRQKKVEHFFMHDFNPTCSHAMSLTRVCARTSLQLSTLAPIYYRMTEHKEPVQSCIGFVGNTISPNLNAVHWFFKEIVSDSWSQQRTKVLY